MIQLIGSWADYEDINDDHDNFIQLPWSVTDHEENDNEHKNSAEVLVVPFSTSTSPSKNFTHLFFKIQISSINFILNFDFNF